MKVEVICKDNRLAEILNIKPLSYKKSLDKAFAKVKSNRNFRFYGSTSFWMFHR